MRSYDEFRKIWFILKNRRGKNFKYAYNKMIEKCFLNCTHIVVLVYKHGVSSRRDMKYHKEKIRFQKNYFHYCLGLSSSIRWGKYTFRLNEVLYFLNATYSMEVYEKPTYKDGRIVYSCKFRPLSEITDIIINLVGNNDFEKLLLDCQNAFKDRRTSFAADNWEIHNKENKIKN